MANILLAVTGSIASYKSADLVSSLKKQGHQVTVLMTQAATEFIQPLTLQVLSQNPVHLDVMKEPYPCLLYTSCPNQFLLPGYQDCRQSFW